jgi:transcriptional regulator GlxA family with amidase domain
MTTTSLSLQTGIDVLQGHSPVGAAVRQPSERCKQIVDEVENIAQAFASRPLRLTDIYRQASVGPGMVRVAFHEVYGCSPRSFFFKQRLRAVRAELSLATQGLSVTHVATAHGFVELGRFAAQYRAAFGETPSATLAHARKEHASIAARSPCALRELSASIPAASECDQDPNRRADDS